MHYNGDDYTETGAGNAGLRVDQDSLNVFELGVGVTAAWQYETASGMDVEPSLHAGYRYDLVGDEVESTNRFIGGGQAFNTQGADPARSTFNAGAGLKLFTTDNWEFSANYDFEFKSDYDAHSGYLRAGVKF
jgi:outer membrane autotransporter protein